MFIQHFLKIFQLTPPATYTPGISCSINMLHHSILHYFCSFAPSTKKVQISLVNTSSSFKTQLKHNLPRKLSLLLPSTPRGPLSLLLLLQCVPLPVCPSSLEHMTARPLHWRVTGSAQRGNSQECAQQETSESLNQGLCFPPIYISNTSYTQS